MIHLANIKINKNKTTETIYYEILFIHQTIVLHISMCFVFDFICNIQYKIKNINIIYVFFSLYFIHYNMDIYCI